MSDDARLDHCMIKMPADAISNNDGWADLITGLMRVTISRSSGTAGATWISSGLPRNGLRKGKAREVEGLLGYGYWSLF